ncbi:MAG: ATP-binding protein [Candidatus Pacebacteria bacterium]|nr:ATP-binding protein [Candidatus Paceibacterota bacterium]
MSDFFRNFKHYMQYPEMKNIRTFLLLALLLLAIEIVFWGNWAGVFFSAIILLLIGAFIMLNIVRVADASLAMKMERSRLNSIVSNISDALVVYDTNFKIMIFNETAEKIFNLPASSIVGRTIAPTDIKFPELKILAQTVFSTLAPTVLRITETDSYPQIIDVTFEDPTLELRVNTSQLVDDQGRVFGFLKIIKDKTRETELLKSKNDFIAIAAHQLRTPLSAIIWALESLKKEKMSAEQNELAETALGASNNLLKTVEDLLNAAKIEEGKTGFDFQKVDLVKFLQELLTEAQIIARKYKVNLFFEPPTEPIEVFVDREKLLMAVSNLLDNSIKYNVSNGQVTVNIQKLSDKPFAQVSIADTGIGMSQEDINKLFTKFFRASDVIKKETSGSGLGLYIVKNIIQKHGGEIWADSEKGRGTTFYFTLPMERRAEVSAPGPFGS